LAVPPSFVGGSKPDFLYGIQLRKEVKSKGGLMAASSSKVDVRSSLAELIATFFFVFLGTGVVVVTGNMLPADMDAARLIAIALGHGLAIALLVSATAHLSGAHINPAVTFAAMITKRMPLAQGVAYIVAQLIGAALAALVVASVLPSAISGGIGGGAGTLGTHALGSGISAGQGVAIEIILTAALVFVVFGAAMDKRGVGMAAPLAIGLVVLVDHLVGVPLTGASMNPARTLGPALIAGSWDNIWVYIVGPLAGAGIAGLIYHYYFSEK
jgi:MIP family channel proteins